MKKILLATIILTAVFCISSVAFAMTDSERQALITQIQTQIAQLTQQLNQMLAEQQQGTGTTAWCHTFNTNMSKGDTGIEVVALQVALQKEGFDISASEIQNSQYGDYVTQAVKSFQEKYAADILSPLGLTQGTGKVATATRNKLNQLYSCSDSVNACTPLWQCAPWGICSNDSQIRSCYDANYCGTTTDKPATIQSCTPTCSPDWQCAPWSTCSNSSQTRSCYDANYCGTTTNAPSQTQSCVANCTPNWQCGSWNTCSNSSQTRSCYDINFCGTTSGQPSQTQSCVSACTPDWQCGSWNTCSNSSQTRSCYDANYCGTTTGAPSQTQSCTSTCSPDWQCGSWDTCINNSQVRSCYDTNYCGLTTGQPNQTQSCTSAVSCTESNWTYTLSPMTCPASGTQTKTWSNIGTCSGGATHSSTETVSCNYQSSDCTSFTYSDWSTCNQSGVQTRTVISTYPYSCAGGNPVTSQSCTYACTPNWSCSGFGSCISGQQMQTCTDSNNCGTTTNQPSLTRECSPPPTVNIEINNSDGVVSVSNNKPVILNWTSTDATSCTASGGWSGSRGTSGSASTSNITSSTTFTITCTGNGGTVSDSVTANPSTGVLVDLKINESNGPVSVSNNILTLAQDEIHR